MAEHVPRYEPARALGLFQRPAGTVRCCMPTSAHDLLAEAGAAGNDLETVARGLLARLAELPGLRSTYLAETRLAEDEQRIVFSYNASPVFHIPEDISL